MAVGVKGTYTAASGVLYTDRRRFNLEDTVTELVPSETPFLVMSSKLGNKPTDDPDFKMFEHTPTWLDHRFYLSATPSNTTNGCWTATTAGSSSNNLLVDNGLAAGDVGWLVPGLVVEIDEANEKIQAIITSVTTQKVISLRLLKGGITYTNSMADADAVWVIGYAAEEGSDAAEPTSDELTVAYGSTQIVKNSFGVTGTMNATRLYGGDERARLRQSKLREHKMLIERALIFGKRVGNRITSDAHLMGNTHNIRTTDGFVSIMDYMEGAKGSEDYYYVQPVTKSTYTWDSFVDNTQYTFAHGSQTKLAICGAGVLGYFSKTATGILSSSPNRIDMTPPVKLYGISVQKLITPHGTLALIHDPILRGASADGNYENYMMIIDPENIQYRPLKGRDTHLQTAIQDNGVDGIVDQYLTEMGLGLTNPKTHQIWKFS